MKRSLEDLKLTAQMAQGGDPLDVDKFRRVFTPEQAIELIDELYEWAGTIGVAMVNAGCSDGVGGPKEAAEAIERLGASSEVKPKDWWRGDPATLPELPMGWSWDTQDVTSPVPQSDNGVRVFVSEDEGFMRVGLWQDRGAVVNMAMTVPLDVVRAVETVRFGETKQDDDSA